MIQLKLSFKEGSEQQEFKIVEGELLTQAIERSLTEVPKGKFETHETFNIVVNGHLIEKDFWDKVKLKETDIVLITPKIGGGESGQLFKQIAIITVTVVASYFFPPSASLANAFIVAGLTIGATLVLNALIPPPVPDLGALGGFGDLDSSQMYSITGQSNQAKRLGLVPKVYGAHRIFPNLAVTPYTEIAVDPNNGETVQYLYSIYDFGLGTPQITELKIGDTPLTTDSFRDFDYRFVDPMKPEPDGDEFDEFLESSFKYYSKKRTVTGLSLSLADGEENVQVADVNAGGYEQEIVLDFVCPRGLFGFTNLGNTVTRSIVLNIQFALVGSSDWRNYNDPDYVDSHNAVGGDDVTEFETSFYADLTGTYYVSQGLLGFGSYTGITNYNVVYHVTPDQRKIIVPEDTRLEIGSKVFYGNRLLGLIESVVDLGLNYELTLDRNITTRRDVIGFQRYASKTIGGSPTLGAPYDQRKLRISRHEAGAAVITGSRQAPVYGNFKFIPKVVGQYKVRVRRVESIGSYGKQKGDDLTWGAITTAFRAPPIVTDKRHVFLELRIKATNQLNGHIQNLSGVAASVLDIYDPDTSTWSRDVTNNPAWIFCDLLSGEVNRKAVSKSRLELESIVEWADFCDEVPTPPPLTTYLEPRFQCNFILDYDTTLQGALAQVGGAAQASLNIIDGKYGVLIDRFKETPVQIFTPRNSRDFSAARTYAPQPHAVKVKYIDPQLGWEVQETIVYDNDYDAVTATEFDELTSFACTNHEQAWRFGRYMIAQNKLRQETINLLVDFENLVCTRGDYVQITQDVMRVGGTPARVKSVSGITIVTDDSLDISPSISYGYTYRSTVDGTITTSTLTPTASNTFDVDGDVPAVGDLIVIGEVGSIVFDCLVKSISPNDDMSANITLVEKADAIYDYESTTTLPDYDPQISETSRPDWYPPKAVIDLEITDNFWECNDSALGYVYFAELIWNMPPGSVQEFFEIWVDDGRGYTLWDKTTAKYYKYIVNQARLDIEHGIKVVAVSASGKKVQLIQMTEVTFTPLTKVTAPSDVESLSMSITNQILQLSWPMIDDCDCREYQIRFSPELNDVWESTIPLITVSKNVNSVSVQARTGVYMIKAIDFNDNQSTNPALGITTIPNLFDLNVIEVLNDAPTFTGEFDRTELLGEAVILQLEDMTVGNEGFYTDGYYTSDNVLDLGEVFTVRLQSLIRAEGYKFGELMADWDMLSDIDHLNTATSADWDTSVEYRATDVFAAMADWTSLAVVDHINYGAGIGFTAWRPIPTIGDATGRIFQFRVLLESIAANVTPRLFDATISTDMPDRTESFENQVSSASIGYAITYAQAFKGPGTTPNIQVSIEDGATGDYWSFDSRTLEGLSIRFYDKNAVQVVRQFDLVAKGYGRKYSTTI